MIRVVIVEDSLEAREGFRYLLSLDSEIKVLKVYERAEDLLSDEAVLQVVDLVLMDIELPGMNGIQATGELKKRHPEVDILILTIFEEQEKIIKAITAGATGYVLKNTDPKDLAYQVKSIKSGGSPISPFVARKLLEEFQDRQGRSRAPGDYNLTNREIEVCRAIIDGSTYREMAEDLHMASATAKKHILNIYRKLQVNSRVEFIKKVLDESLFDTL